MLHPQRNIDGSGYARNERGRNRRADAGNLHQVATKLGRASKREDLTVFVEDLQLHQLELATSISGQRRASAGIRSFAFIIDDGEQPHDAIPPDQRDDPELRDVRALVIMISCRLPC